MYKRIFKKFMDNLYYEKNAWIFFGTQINISLNFILP